MDLNAEIKKHYPVIVLAVLVAVLGTALAVTQLRLSRIAGLVEDSRRAGEKGRDDPYDRAVKNQILKIYPSIKKLYQTYTAKNPAVREGNVTLDWSVDTDGEPERVEVVTSDFNDPAFESGIVKAVQGITFPEPPVKRYVTHTFRFKDAEKGGKTAP
ncbi:MAG: energy transducer TonB [Spirochaetes bacterium]|nr:energy transducer TonB [Spirochaetota bacterium]